MMIKVETLIYKHNKDSFQGYIAYDDAAYEKRPGILVAHAWFGQNEFAREKACALAKMGYVGFALDMYGEGICASSPEAAQKLMNPIVEDPLLLRGRIVSALETLKGLSVVNPQKTGAIGFCFGGLCVLELAKSGAEISGVVSFHGVLGNPFNLNIKPTPKAKVIHPSILILHGYKDPIVPPEDVAAFERELDSYGVDWQLHAYGKASHAFSNPDAQDKESGFCYNEKSAKRAWRSMQNFFEEIFS